MLDFKNGDLVHVPSSATLTHKSEKYPMSFMRLREPQKLLIAEAKRKENTIGVLYDGDIWYVDKKDVYSIGDEDG
jgi:hypothetical protein